MLEDQFQKYLGLESLLGHDKWMCDVEMGVVMG